MHREQCTFPFLGALFKCTHNCLSLAPYTLVHCLSSGKVFKLSLDLVDLFVNLAKLPESLLHVLIVLLIVCCFINNNTQRIRELLGSA